MTHENYHVLYSQVSSLEKERNDVIEKAYKQIEEICAKRKIAVAAIDNEIIDIRNRILKKIAEAK